jgi:hypothetical protein
METATAQADVTAANANTTAAAVAARNKLF